MSFKPVETMTKEELFEYTAVVLGVVDLLMAALEEIFESNKDLSEKDIAAAIGLFAAGNLSQGFEKKEYFMNSMSSAWDYIKIAEAAIKKENQKI